MDFVQGKVLIHSLNRYFYTLYSCKVVGITDLTLGFLYLSNDGWMKFFLIIVFNLPPFSVY